MLRYQVNSEQLNETEGEDEYYDGGHCCPLDLAAFRLGCADVLNCRLMFLLPCMCTWVASPGLGPRAPCQCRYGSHSRAAPCDKEPAG